MFRFWKSTLKSKPRRPLAHRCRVEGLETRSLMAVVAAADPGNSKVLNVRGDAASDTAMVEVDKTGIHVYSLASSGVKQQNFSLGKFNQINVGLGGGDDVFLLSVPAAAKGTSEYAKIANMKFNIWGDAGNDKIWTSLRTEAVDKVFADGGTGLDRLEHTNWLPRGESHYSMETIDLGDLAKAQSQLRQDNAVPSLYKQISRVPLASTVYDRSALRYRQVIDQFDVGFSNAQRYRPGYDGNYDTRCNIFAGDVARAMNVPLPTKGQLNRTNDPMTAGATALHNWLSTQSARDQGWVEINPATPEGMRALQANVQAGKMAVASTKGHIAVVRPDQTFPSASNWKQMLVAQAGADNFSSGTLARGFGGSASQARIFINIR